MNCLKCGSDKVKHGASLDKPESVWRECTECGTHWHVFMNPANAGGRESHSGGWWVDKKHQGEWWPWGLLPVIAEEP